VDLRISEFQNFSVSAFQLLLPSSHFIREADRRSRICVRASRAAWAKAPLQNLSVSAFTSMTGRAAAITPYLVP
jgi:hypothetical protein